MHGLGTAPQAVPDDLARTPCLDAGQAVTLGRLIRKAEKIVGCPVEIEWAPLGIRINCVAPGAIATEGMNVYSEEARKAMPRSNLMKRFGDVRDIADAVCYLAGPSGSFMTGEVVTVDGGTQIWGDQWTIPRPEWFGE